MSQSIKLDENLEHNVKEINKVIRNVLGHPVTINDWTPGYDGVPGCPQIIFKCKVCKDPGSFILNVDNYLIALDLKDSDRTASPQLHKIVNYWHLCYYSSWPQCQDDIDLEPSIILNLTENQDYTLPDIVNYKPIHMCRRLLPLL